MNRIVPIVFFILLNLSAPAQTRKDPILVTDMLKIKSISGLTLSKDGSKAAFTLTSIEPDGEARIDFKYVNHIYVVPADGSAPPRELTVKESSSQPAWSPDGKQLAFVRTVDSKPQIFLLPIDGGEPVQFTHYKYGAATPKWSPDGKKILFSSNIDLTDLLKDSSLNPEYALPKWPFEQPGFERNSSLLLPIAKPNPDGNMDEIRAYLDADITDKKAKILNKLDFQDESQVSSGMSFNHFFLQDIRPGAQPIEITHGFYGFTNALFMPDGKHLVLTGDIDSTEHPDRSMESELYLADSNGKNLRLLMGKKNIIYNNVAISPSGEWLVFQSEPTDSVAEALLNFIPLHNLELPVKNTVPISLPFDRSKNNCTWSSDEKYLYFTAPSNGGFPLYRVNLSTKNTEQLSDPDSGIGSFDLAANRLVFVKTSVANPFELYSSGPSMENPQPISSFNREWLQNKQISPAEKHSFTNNQGMVVEYWVMKPANYKPGKKYPLLLEIHGGPSSMWGPGESTMWHEFQVFCSKGYGVVYCNPRGSGGYGSDFLRANIKDWGAGPAADVLTALDSCISGGWADTSRLLISGGSYGGYLVAWIIAHDHRFKAACSQRGVYDLATFFGEGNAWRLVPEYFGGYPWEQTVHTLLQKESPIQYVQQITTPYIIFHGENDRRTGYVQGEMMYRSLKVLDRPVEYVRHPGATHEITRSGDNRQRIDQLLRTYEFFERWLKKQRFSSK
jgi:dipeptidyl aminopeptidase/acylaminoacyl peptidase